MRHTETEMKRLSALFLSLSLFLCPVIASAAISSAVEWEIRAAGSTTNGGGFKAGAAGTDYSQQDSAQESYTTLAMTAATTTLTCGGADTFDANIVGNIIYISGGTNFVTGWYEVTARASGTSITIDRDATSGGNGSSGTGNMGGALFWNDTWNDASNTLTGGQKIHVKADATHTLTGGISFSTGGSGSAVLKVIGYNTTREDDPTGTSRPLIAAGANAFRFNGRYTNIYNLRVTTTDTVGFEISGQSLAQNVHSNNSSGSANRHAMRIVSNRGGIAVNCELQSANGNAIFLENDGQKVFGSYLHDSTTCINITGPYSMAAFNVLDTCTTGISWGAFDYAGAIIFNTLYSGTTGISGGTNNSYSMLIWANLIDSFTTGISLDAVEDSNLYDYNNYNNNTTDTSNVTKGPNATAVDPEFTDAAGGDFSVGTNVKATAFPGAFNGSSTTGYLDQGAVQRQEPAGGGTNASGAVSVAF